jgi:hypothetical protein
VFLSQTPWLVTIIGGYLATRCGDDAAFDCEAWEIPVPYFVVLALLACLLSVWPAVNVWHRSNGARRYLIVANGIGVLAVLPCLGAVLVALPLLLALYLLPGLSAMTLLMTSAARAWCLSPTRQGEPRPWQRDRQQDR